MRATDDLDLTTSSTNQGRLTINAQVPGDAFPERHAQTSPAPQTGLQVLHLDLAGTATDDIGVAAVRVTIQDSDTGRYLQANGTLAAGVRRCSTPRWPRPNAHQHDVDAVGRPADAGRLRGHRLRLRHRGPAGPVDPGATARYPIYPGDLPPTVRPRPCSRRPTGAAFTDGKIVVTGRVEDDQQIAQASGGDREQPRPVHELDAARSPARPRAAARRS